MNVIFISALVLAHFFFAIAGYINIWIFYSVEKKRYPLFPILNPFAFSTYELLLNSITKLKWKIEGENKKLKRVSNKMRQICGILLIIGLIFFIMNVFLSNIK